MQKIGIINLNHSFNYGAVIQCRALCKQVESFGLEPIVINYLPDYVTEKQKVKVSPLKHARYCGSLHKGGFKKLIWMVRGFCACVVKNILYKKQRAWQYSVFTTCRKRFFNLTSEYRTIADLTNNPPKMDAYICGSDQIWTFAVTGGKPDPAFFLKFGDKNSKRIAYAASTDEGILRLPEEKLETLFKDFSFISLRENTVLEPLKEKTGRSDIIKVLDPTLLMPKQVYEEWEEPSEGGKFIFCYIASSIRQAGIAETVKSVSKKTGLPVKYININEFGNKEFSDFEELCGKTPGQFLSYIRNAQFIVTDSFHVLTISLVYHKEFVLIMGTNKRQDRILETVNLFSLNDRCVFRGEDAAAILDTVVDYSVYDKQIGALKTESISFLKTSIFDN